MNAPPNGGGPPQTPQAYRHSIEEWRQQALAQRSQYEERVKEQVQRNFQEYSPPWYASVIGFRRDWNLLVTTSRISGFASTLGRDLTDTETKAIAEYTLNNIHINAAAKWATLGLAAYMTYRGRRTWQFPFYKPKLGGKFNPNEATSIFTNQKIRGIYPRLTWHTLRFTAYAAVTMLMVEPVFRAVSFIRTESAMSRDPRLEGFMKEAASRVEKVMSQGPPRRGQHRPAPVEGETTADYESMNKTEEYGKDTSDSGFYNQPERPFTWGRPAAQPAPIPTQTQASDDDWNILDDDDDASPIAGSARSQSASATAGGSAWDRLRQQSQVGQKSQQQSQFESQGGWAGVGRAKPNSRAESQSGWGNDSSASSEWSGSKDNYSYSSADEYRSLAKEQAQKEFDEMLERERRGAEQGRSGGR